MSEAIKKVIYTERIVLSKAYKIGEFIGRNFYHSLFGFGKVQSQNDNEEPTIEIAWDELGTFVGLTSYIFDEGENLERLNEKILDDEEIKKEINEDALFRIEDPMINGENFIEVWHYDG